MPASVCDPVSSALRLSLSADEPHTSSLLDNRLLSSAKSVLLSKIEFEEAGDYQSNVLDGLKSKYVVIRPQQKPSENNKFAVKKDGNSSNNNKGQPSVSNGLPTAQHTLFLLTDVQLGWVENDWRAGAGMQNVGNTCYLNSTLQALLHVPAFSNWLVSEDRHAQRCRQPDSCVICGMHKTLIAARQSSNPIKPWQVYSKLRLICKHLTPGRQEDAHEFLRYLVEAMEKSYLSRFPGWERLDQYSKETTPLNQILGGYLRSAVRCLSCGHVSTTFQHFQDLLLDIRRPSTLEEALDGFFSRERLEDLGYKCEACNKKVSATKQFFIERAPMVLCIALKRFSLAGGKLSKHISFRKRISLQNYMFKKQPQPLWYRLSSLVCHLGASQHCGHYTACAVGPNGAAMLYDDSSVRGVQLAHLLASNAYIMFYEKENEQPSAGTSTVACASQSVNTPTASVPVVVQPKTTNSLIKLQEDYRSNGHDSDSSQNIINRDKVIALPAPRLPTPVVNGESKPSPVKCKPQVTVNGKSNDTSEASGWKISEENKKTSPSASTPSPLVIKLSNGTNVNGASSSSITSNGGPSNTLLLLQKNSHSGYSAPVSTWNSTHSQIQRQAYDESRSERKRALDSTDDMDRGRVKKMKHNGYHRFNNSHRSYNPFQIRQDKQRQWNNGGSFHNNYDRRNYNGHRHHGYNKHRKFHNNRYNGHNNYNRHH